MLIACSEDSALQTERRYHAKAGNDRDASAYPESWVHSATRLGSRRGCFRRRSTFGSRRGCFRRRSTFGSGRGCFRRRSTFGSRRGCFCRRPTFGHGHPCRSGDEGGLGTLGQHWILRIRTHLETRHQEIAITDFADECGNSDVIGRIILIDLFQDPSSRNSTVTRPGAFDVWLPTLDGQGSTPTGNRAIVSYDVTEADGSGTGYLAQSGTVMVTSVSGTAISATFDVSIDGDKLHGSFVAPTCDPWTRSATVP